MNVSFNYFLCIRRKRKAPKQEHIGTFILAGEEMKCSKDKTTTSFGMSLFLKWKVDCRRRN
jgi:fructose-1,6-bisphosphatase